jgi:superfamily II DNA or RNA helicase
LRVEEAHAKALAALNKHTRSQPTEADDVLRNAAKAGNVKTLLPLRDYQLQAVHLIKLRNALLCGDDLGLGKTAIALGAIAAGMRPAIIVCKTHLQAQWIEEAHKFLEGVKEHVVTKTKAYELPEHNFLVITYSKLSGWAEYLKDYKLIVFDEAQELRRAGTQKYAAANALCNSTPNRVVT